jgi:cytochrome c oxidase subunit I
MATIERAPRTLGFIPRPTALHGLVGWLTTVDHKKIGILYLVTAFFFFLVGGIEALLIRVQLAKPGMTFVSPETYNQLFTMHATTMIFLAVMPLSAAFMNFVMPLQIGARDVAFPRLNAFSYWTFLFGGIFLNLSWFYQFITGKPSVPNMGWFGYANLTSIAYNPGLGVDFWILGLQFLGIGTLISGFNFLTTIFNMRAPGMSLMRMPVFVWITLIVSVLIIFAFPAITVALIMLLFDRTFAANFFNTMAGGSPVFWQHLFWTFGHPEVYILILPAMGIVSEILPTFSRKPLFGYSVIVFSSALIGFLGFAVWSHHMFTVGMGPVVNSIFALTTMAIAIPTGVKIFNWLATMWGGRVRFATPMLFAVAFLSNFTIGGLSGFMHAAAPSDAIQHDTYFIVAHIHYVLIGGAMFGLLGGIWYWFPKMFGVKLSETWGTVAFWLIVIGHNVGFFPFHFLGLAGMPRRIYTYSAEMGWNTSNFIATLGVFTLALGVLVFLIGIIVSIRRGVKAGNDPWETGRTLEWSIPSPPAVYNFAVTPQVSARDQHWEERMGRVKTPTYPKGPKEKIHMPGPSWMPFGTGIGILLFCFGMLHHAFWLAILGGLVTLICVYGWAFEGEGGFYMEAEVDR